MIKDEFIINGKHGRPFLCDVRYNNDGKQKPIIIFIHGFKGFKDWGHFNLIADYFGAKGFVYVKLNLSHNGTTPEHPYDFVDLEAFGNNNFSKELDDVGSVIDYLFSNECIVPQCEMNQDNLYLIGHSRGGGLALLKAGEDSRVKKVITFAAINDFAGRWPQSLVDEWENKGVHYVLNGRTNQEMPLYFQIVEDFRANNSRFDIPEVVRSLQIPILVAHGTDDETLNVSMVTELTSWNSNLEPLIIEGANHVFGGSHPFENNELPEHTKLLLSRSYQFMIE